MLHVNKLVSVIATLLVAVMISCSTGFSQNKPATHNKPFDPVAFIKSFRIGMTYAEVQALLPKGAEQDALAYVISEEAFLLGVDIPVPGQATWSSWFKFDTLDAPSRRPEQLIEFSCSAGLSTKDESFETIVRKVTAAFGDPVELNRSKDRFKQAGWRVDGGSLLTLDYSTMPGAATTTVNVDFVIKKNRRREPPDARAVA